MVPLITFVLSRRTFRPSVSAAITTAATPRGTAEEERAPVGRPAGRAVVLGPSDEEALALEVGVGDVDVAVPDVDE